MSVITIIRETQKHETVKEISLTDIYDISLGDKLITRDGEVCVIASLGECPYYGYEHYPVTYVVEANSAWAKYLVIDLDPAETQAAFATSKRWQKQEPQFFEFDEVQAAGDLIHARDLGWIGQVAS